MSLVAAALVAITALIALEGGGAASLLRHAYLVPVLAAALRFGAVGGGLAAAAAVLLSAPLVLPEIERSGVTTEAVEGLVTFAVLGLVGVLSGVLRISRRSPPPAVRDSRDASSERSRTRPRSMSRWLGCGPRSPDGCTWTRLR